MEPDLLTPLLGPAVLYLLGFLSGYVVATWAGNLPHASFQRTVALLVTFVWIMSVTASIVVPTYTTSIALHGIMGAVSGYLFTGEEGLRLLPRQAPGQAAPAPPNPPREDDHGPEGEP